MNRRIVPIFLLFALALGACTNDSGFDDPLPTGDPFAIVTITATPTQTPTPTPAPTATPSPTTSVLGTKTVKPTPSVTSKPATGSGLATYDLNVACTETLTRKDGTSKSSAYQRVVKAVAGAKETYDFTYQRDESTNNPVVQKTQRCTIKTIKRSSGTEPRLAGLLGCNGEAVYGSGQGPTSVTSKSWKSLSAMTSGFTHEAKAPKKADQVSEKTVCTVSIVRR